jgi:plasmid stabilization system protein ParE
MAYHLKFTDEAADLLLANARWYLETSQSVDVAVAWYDGFLDELESLETNPWRGCIAPESGLFDFELRELHYGSGKRSTHRALYRVTKNAVEVLTIRHHAQRPLSADDFSVQ